MDRVVGEAVAVVAVGMAAGDTENALADQVRQRVTSLVRRSLVEQAPGERLDQAVDALGGLQQNRPAVGAGLLLVELGVQRLVEQIREQNSLWYSVGRHARASVVAQVVVNTALVPHGGSCICIGIGTRQEFSGLKARYDAMFDRQQHSPNVKPVQAGKNTPTFTPDAVIELHLRRPVVLIGDVGVGKTSFLKHLMYVSAFEEFRNALYIYIDFGSQGALTESLRGFVLNELERQLLTRHEIDVYEDAFIRGVYHSEIVRFQRGIFGRLRERDGTAYEKKLLEFLQEKTQDRMII